MSFWRSCSHISNMVYDTNSCWSYSIWISFRYCILYWWQFLFGNFGHFPLEFFCQICTQNTLWHLLGPFLVNFGICQFLASPEPFKIFAKSGYLHKIKDILKMVHWVLHIQIWYKAQGWIGYMMGPLLVGCDTLKGPLWAVKLGTLLFDTFATLWRAHSIDLFHEESVHRCAIGCSTYPGLDFWICDRLAIWWAIKWQFLRCQKVTQMFMWWVLDILTHKLEWRCQYMWIYGVFKKILGSGVWAMAIWVIWWK